MCLKLKQTGHILTILFQESLWKHYRNDILDCVNHFLQLVKEKRTLDVESLSVSNILDKDNKPDHLKQDLWARFVTLVCQHAEAIMKNDILCLVIDDNMYYRSMRYKYYQLARKCKCMTMVSINIMRGSRGGRGSGPPPPPKNHKAIGLLGNTGPNLLQNHKATKPAFNVVLSSARKHNTI